MSPVAVRKWQEQVLNTYVDYINTCVYIDHDAKRSQTFETGKGGHLKVTLNGKRSVLPMHGKKEIPTGTWHAIKKQLGIKE